MTQRKRVSIQLTREQIGRLLEALTADADLQLRLKLRMARERFGDRRAEKAALNPDLWRARCQI